MHKLFWPSLGFFVSFGVISACEAGTFTVLHSFGLTTGDGVTPVGGLTIDSAGNLYGTTTAGGSNLTGTVFEIANGPLGYTYSTLYSFCALPSTACGASPASALVVDTSGNVYGTTRSGGSNTDVYGRSAGVVFQLTNSGGAWTMTKLHDFCSNKSGGGVCLDGRNNTPYNAGLSYAGATSGSPYNGTSSLYGVASYGGGNDGGTLYQLTPGVPWSFANVYDFCLNPNPDNSCPDGAFPAGAVTVNSTGAKIYGTTSGNGPVLGSYGTIYQINTSGWSESLLYHFHSSSVPNNGRTPLAALSVQSGHIYVAPYGGGSDAGFGDGVGTIVDLLRGSSCTQDNITELCVNRVYIFCNDPTIPNCTSDGANPDTGAALAQNGTDYWGTTTGGGTNQRGAIYKWSSAGVFTQIHAFCAQAYCTDGSLPTGGLVTDSAGNMYGVTEQGGASANGAFRGYGEVFEYTP